MSGHVIIAAWHYLLLHIQTQCISNPFLQMCLWVCHDTHIQIGRFKHTEWPHTSKIYISGKSIIKWFDTTIHVYSSLRYDVTYDHWSQSSSFHLILGILFLVHLKWDKICYCCFSANAIAIFMSGQWSLTRYIIMVFFLLWYFKVWLIDMTCVCKKKPNKISYLWSSFFCLPINEMYGEMIFCKYF